MSDLWAHQQKAIDLAKTRKNLALFFDIGTGKTAAMINILREDFNVSKRIRRVLVVCPLAVAPQWASEIARWSRIPPDAVHVLTQAGSTRTGRMETLATHARGGIVVTNYEGLRIANFYQELLKWSPEIIVMDEAHRLKDSGSVQSKKIFPLCRAADRRFILTGTPILNSMLDLFGQYKVLDPSVFGSNAWEFKTKYFYNANAGIPRLKFPRVETFVGHL